MVGWHHRLDGAEFEQAPGDRQGGLACCSPWGRREWDTTEWLNWELSNSSSHMGTERRCWLGLERGPSWENDCTSILLLNLTAFRTVSSKFLLCNQTARILLYQSEWTVSLVHTITELTDSKGLQSARWRPRKVIVEFQSKFEGLRTNLANGVALVQRLQGSRPRKSWCLSLSQKAGKNLSCSSKAVREKEFPYPEGGQPFCSVHSFNLLDETHSHWGPGMVDLNVKLIQKHPHGNTQNMVCPNTWVSCGPVKLRCKVNHHNDLP